MTSPRQVVHVDSASVSVVGVSGRFRILPLVILLITLIGVISANATATPQDPAPDERELVRQGLDRVPLRSEALGLSIHLPAGSRVATEQVGTGTSISVMDPAATPAWTMTIRPLEVQSRITAKEQLVSHLDSLRDAGRSFELLSSRAPEHHPDGWQCVIEQSREDATTINGWMLVPRGETSFIVASFVTTRQQWPTLEPILQASLATMKLISLEVLSEQRLQRVANGAQFLSSLTADDLRELLGHEQWYRIYRPSSGAEGEEEIGYTRIRIREARRGELSRERDASTYKASEREMGMLVSIEGRLIQSAERRVYYDSLGMYWLSWDGQVEAWTMTATQRQGEATLSENEIGVRERPSDQEPVPTLTVVKTSQREYSRDPVKWQIPDVYMPQALSWLIGQLAARKSIPAQSMAYYTYDTTETKLALRVDTWEPAGDGSSHFTLISKLGADREPSRAYFDRTGRLMRRVHANGVVTEPITLEELRRLWKSKGLLTTR